MRIVRIKCLFTYFASRNFRERMIIHRSLYDMMVGNAFASQAKNIGERGSIIGGAAHIHIFVFTGRKKNQFQKNNISENEDMKMNPTPIIEHPGSLAVV